MAARAVKEEALRFTRRELGNGHIKEALDILARSLADSPDDPHLLRARAHCQHASGDSSAASSTVHPVSALQASLYSLASCARPLSLPLSDPFGRCVQAARRMLTHHDDSPGNGSSPSPPSPDELTSPLTNADGELLDSMRSSEHASTLSLAASSCALHGDTTTADSLYATACSLVSSQTEEEPLFPDELAHANALLGRAQVGTQTGNFESAENFAVRALKLVERQLSDQSPFVSPILNVLSENHARRALQAASEGKEPSAADFMYAEGFSDSALAPLGAKRSDNRAHFVRFPRLAAVLTCRQAAFKRMSDSNRANEGERFREFGYKIAQHANGPSEAALEKLATPKAPSRRESPHSESCASAFHEHHTGCVLDVSLMLPLLQCKCV